MDPIHEKHKCLVNGLIHLFALFVKAHYISSTDVLYPPQDVDVGCFHRLGFDPEVIDLIQLLPVLRDEAIWGYNEEGVEMIPRAKLVNYLKQPEADVGDDMLQRLRWVDHRDKDWQGIFPPSILRLTFPAFYGVNVLYDVHDQTIMEWCHLNQKQWQDCPRQPCEVFFSKVFEKVNTLEYVPFFNPDGEADVLIRKIIENPVLFQNIWPGGVRLPTDPQAAIQQYGENRDGRDLIRHTINEWRALQKLYRDAGWESEFNGERFDNRRRDLLRMMDDFQDQSSEWSMIPPHRRTPDERIAEQEFRQQRDMFWAESAGEYYV